jgi:regulator of sirC expression with transglutaminase-like and TPR domain
MDAAARWRTLVRGPEAELPLDEAALLISAHATGQVDVARGLRHLDEVAAGCGQDTVEGLVELLFVDLGLQGDTEHYGDPRNSYLDQVLERRRGIPISLAVLVIEVGRRVGITLEGVGMPGHFLVQPAGRASGEALLDPFSGRWLDPDECRIMAAQLVGPTTPWSPSWLEPTPPRAILARMLANLASGHRTRQELGSLRRISELAAVLPSRRPAERYQVAEDLAAGGRLDLAAGLLDDAASDLRLAPDDAARLRARATGLRARLN